MRSNEPTDHDDQLDEVPQETETAVKELDDDGSGSGKLSGCPVGGDSGSCCLPECDFSVHHLSDLVISDQGMAPPMPIPQTRPEGVKLRADGHLILEEGMEVEQLRHPDGMLTLVFSRKKPQGSP